MTKFTFIYKTRQEWGRKATTPEKCTTEEDKRANCQLENKRINRKNEYESIGTLLKLIHSNYMPA